MTELLDIFSKTEIVEKQPNVIVDNREKNSLVVSELYGRGCKIQFKQLPVADYIVNEVAIERKTLSDLKASIVNRRIMQQLHELKQYPKCVLLIEGLEETDPYTGRIHENAMRGFLLSVALEYKVPIIFTLNEEDTAKYIIVLAKRNEKKEHTTRVSKIQLSEKEQLQFILEGFPQIGPVAAKKLLSTFKTIKKITSASQKELEDCVGKKAEIVFRICNETY